MFDVPRVFVRVLRLTSRAMAGSDTSLAQLVRSGCVAVNDDADDADEAEDDDEKPAEIEPLVLGASRRRGAAAARSQRVRRRPNRVVLLLVAPHGALVPRHAGARQRPANAAATALRRCVAASSARRR